MEPKEVDNIISVKTEPGRDGPPRQSWTSLHIFPSSDPRKWSRCLKQKHQNCSLVVDFSISTVASLKAESVQSPLRSISSWLLLLLILLNNCLLELLFSYSLIRTSTLSQFVILVHFKSTLKPTLIQKGKNKHINAPVPYFCEVLPSRTRQTT